MSRKYFNRRMYKRKRAKPTQVMVGLCVVTEDLYRAYLDLQWRWIT